MIDDYPRDVVPTQSGVDQSIATSTPLITMIRGRLALVYFAESAHVPSPNALRDAMRAIHDLCRQVTP